MRRAPSGCARPRWTSADPTAATMARKVENSSSTSRKSETTCSTPVPAAPTPSAIPISSSGAAVSVGVKAPVDVLWLRVLLVVKPSAPASMPSRASSAIAAMSSGVASSWFGAALPHHVQTQRAVRHLSRDVDVVGTCIDRVEKLAERVPVPRQALVQRGTRDVLDAFHQLDEAGRGRRRGPGRNRRRSSPSRRW